MQHFYDVSYKNVSEISKFIEYLFVFALKNSLQHLVCIFQTLTNITKLKIKCESLEFWSFQIMLMFYSVLGKKMKVLKCEKQVNKRVSNRK